MNKAKIIISAAMLLAIEMCISGCGKSENTQPTQSITVAESVSESEAPAISYSTADIMSKILESVELTSMTEVDSDRIGNYLSIDMNTVSEFAMSICGSGGFADEVCIFKMNNESDTTAVVDAINARIESRSVDFKDYNPDEYEELQNAIVKTKGNYVFMVVCSDPSAAEAIFDEMTN